MTLLISLTFLILIVNHKTYATTSEQSSPTLDEILNSEQKIMKYDARTNETTEVNIEELRQIVAQKNNTNEDKEGYSTSSYTPRLKANILSSEISPLATPSANRVTNTSVFPYSATCRVSFTTSAGTTKYCTAAIIGPNLALTAAHCVFNGDNVKYED